MKFQDEWSGSQFYRFPPSLDQADSYIDGKRQEKISIRVIFKGYKPYGSELLQHFGQFLD